MKTPGASIESRRAKPRNEPEILQLTRLVLPHARVPGDALRRGLAEEARWFLDQLALEMLFTIRHIHRMTMGEIRIPTKIAAPGFLINAVGSEGSLGWQRHFASPLHQYGVRVKPAKAPPRWGTPFSRLAEHIALFDSDNVLLFGPQVATFLSAIDGERPGGTQGSSHRGPRGPHRACRAACRGRSVHVRSPRS